MKSMIEWDQFYMTVAKAVAGLSYDDKRKVGCVIEKNGNIISFSYNGTIPGSSNRMRDADGKTLPEVLHAEAMAIIKAMNNSNNCQGATVYVTLSPCVECSKLLITAGVRRVVYLEPYKCMDGVKLLKECGVLVAQVYA